MREAGGHDWRGNMMDGLALHYYTSVKRLPDGTRVGDATRFDEAEWIEIVYKGLVMDELVKRHSTIMDKYDPDKRVAMVVDEWGTWYDVEPGTNPGFLYQQSTLRDAVVAALNFHIFHRHADRVVMANIAQTVNVLQSMVLTDKEKMLLTPTYHVFEMYKVHQGATSLPLELSSPDYVINHVFRELEKEGVETELVQLSGREIRGCIACYKCFENKDQRCAVKNDIANECIEKIIKAEGMILGSPVYFPT